MAEIIGSQIGRRAPNPVSFTHDPNNHINFMKADLQDVKQKPATVNYYQKLSEMNQDYEFFWAICTPC